MTNILVSHCRHATTACGSAVFNYYPPTADATYLFPIKEMTCSFNLIRKFEISESKHYSTQKFGANVVRNGPRLCNSVLISASPGESIAENTCGGEFEAYMCFYQRIVLRTRSTGINSSDHLDSVVGQAIRGSCTSASWGHDSAKFRSGSAAAGALARLKLITYERIGPDSKKGANAVDLFGYKTLAYKLDLKQG